ncbi:hypothetical protein BFJ69_g17427 [Fusarium oxysporum]|uniref:Uncharacterized protein n=1 Tax=Fusarium oxysporum TaxID=5507 RepID=A0A420M8C7_FUSOX|nr:hypothetical protein BFJ69_g17427 [Fusarium oxysporum]
MSTVGDSALQGHEETISGEHTFKVPKNGKFKGRGVLIMIWRPNEEDACFQDKDTGDDGYDVFEGGKVRVFKGTAQFIWS